MQVSSSTQRITDAQVAVFTIQDSDRNKKIIDIIKTEQSVAQMGTLNRSRTTKQDNIDKH